MPVTTVNRGACEIAGLYTTKVDACVFEWAMGMLDMQVVTCTARAA